MKSPNPYYTEIMTVEEFLLGMLSLGKPIEISLVGAFEDATTKGRGSRRDIDLPLHRDGVYSKKLAEAQGGTYVEQPNIDFVGLYCLRDGSKSCYTTVSTDGGRIIVDIELKKGTALIFNNNLIEHGRRGPVGSRILIRAWVTADDRAA